MTTNAQPNLTPDQVRRHLDGDSRRCPYCRSDQIEGDAVEIEDGTARQGVHCRACDRGWTYLYDLVGLAEDDGPVHAPRTRADWPVVGHCGEANGGETADQTPSVDAFLRSGGRVVIDANAEDVQAFAYSGDTPVVFGAGDTTPEAIAALEGERGREVRRPESLSR